MLRLFLLPICCILLFACQESPNKSKDIDDIIGLGSGGDFRGNAMGDDVTKVLAREATNVVYNMPDEITCRIPMDMVDQTFYEVNYSFDEGELNHIQLDLFPGTDEGVERLKSDFSEFYNAHHGEIEKPNTWIARSSRGKDVVIRMINRSQTVGKPCLSITFLEEK